MDLAETPNSCGTQSLHLTAKKKKECMKASWRRQHPTLPFPPLKKKKCWQWSWFWKFSQHQRLVSRSVYIKYREKGAIRGQKPQLLSLFWKSSWGSHNVRRTDADVHCCGIVLEKLTNVSGEPGKLFSSAPHSLFWLIWPGLESETDSVLARWYLNPLNFIGMF